MTSEASLAQWHQWILSLPLSEAREKVWQRARQNSARSWTPAGASSLIPKGSTVGLFASNLRWHEPQETYLQDIEANFETAYPGMLDGQLKFYKARRSDCIDDSKLGVATVKTGLPEIVPTLVLTPALMVDCAGNRIGRGLGAFDSFFARHPQIKRYALVHSDYVFSNFPTTWMHDHDQRVFGVLTENKFLSFEESEI
jgi:5-formyltetrahydrofolate cyclo-ligase